MPLSTSLKRDFYWEPSDTDFDDPKVKKRTAPYFLGYRGMTKGKEAYIISNTNSESGELIYSDLLILDGAAIANLPTDLSNLIVSDAGQLFTGLEPGTNISFKSYSYRVSTSKQQQNWEATKRRVISKLADTVDERKRVQLTARLDMINNELFKQRQVEKHVWSREYLMVPFANSVSELTELIESLNSLATNDGTRPFQFTQLTREQKEERLFAINNPTQHMR